MRKSVAIAIGGLLVLGVILWLVFSKKPELDGEIRSKLEADSEELLTVTDVSLKSSPEIREFYKNRDYMEAWSANGKLTNLAEDMIAGIKEVKYDGLNPNDYHLETIETLWASVSKNRKSTDGLVAIDLLLTDSFFRLSHDLDVGKIDPTDLKSEWELPLDTPKVSYLELLESSLQKRSIRSALENVAPKLDMYQKGREVMRSLEEKASSDTLAWEKVNLDKSLKVGDSHPAIPGLRSRLVFWGSLEPYEVENEALFDSKMEEGLKDYQYAHGMEPDGAIGNLTMESLNNSPARLMEIAAVNLERMRWMPDTLLDGELILVNVANFQLDYLNKKDTVLSAKVIVGKEYNESPVFSADMSYIAFSPYWNIPESIVKDEIIPAVKKNKKYLDEKGMEVVDGSGNPISSKSIDWSADPFPYLVRQKPGGSNSLGLVKFMFPNKHNVYIHDTPARSLFDLESRALSHGCIRVQDPVKFAEILLKDDPEWSLEKINEAMDQEEEKKVNLKEHIPVVIFYLTFWADSDGGAHFKSDIYGRDGEVLAALKQ